MAQVIWLWCYLAMIVGGVLSFILQVLYSPAVQLEFLIASVAIALSGVALLWADFLRPPSA